MKKYRAGYFQKKVPNTLYHIFNFSTQFSAEFPHFCNIKERQFQNLFVVLSTLLYFSRTFLQEILAHMAIYYSKIQIVIKKRVHIQDFYEKSLDIMAFSIPLDIIE